MEATGAAPRRAAADKSIKARFVLQPASRHSAAPSRSISPTSSGMRFNSSSVAKAAGWGRRTRTTESRAALCRRLQVLGRDAADVLGKVPVVPLDIRRSVGPVAVELVLGLGEDGGTGALGALEVLVHVVNVDVHDLCHVAEALRVLKLRAGMPHHHDTVGLLHLSVHDLSTWPGHPHALSEAEGLDQPVQRASHVFVVQVRSDAGHVLRRVCGHRAFLPCAAPGFYPHTCGEHNHPCTQGARDLAREFGRSNSNVATTPYSGVGASLSKVGAAAGSCGRSL